MSELACGENDGKCTASGYIIIAGGGGNLKGKKALFRRVSNRSFQLSALSNSACQLAHLLQIHHDP